MPTIIDELIVSLGLDPKQFKKGEQEYLDSLRKMERESQKSHKSMTKDTTELSNTVGIMTKRVLGLATAFLSVGAAKSFTDQLTTGDSAMGRLASNIGSTTEELSLWEGIVKRVGGDAKGVDHTFENIARSIQQNKIFGTYSEQFRILEQMGVKVIGRSFTDIMLDVSKKMETMTRPQAREFGLQAQIDPGLLDILVQGNAATQKYINEQHGIVTSESSRLAQERQDAEAKMTAALYDLGRDIVTDLSPGIKSLSSTIAEVLNEWHKITGGHPLTGITSGTWFNPTGMGKEPQIDQITGQPIGGNVSESSLGSLIRKLESGNNYGAINTDLLSPENRKNAKDKFEKEYQYKSLNDVIKEEKEGKYQAAGAYQIRATTLQDAIKSMNLSGNESFNKEMQDRIFNEFLAPRRFKDNQSGSAKGLMNEFESLKGHESELSALLSQINNAGDSYQNTSHETTMHINEINVHTNADNSAGLIDDIRRNVGKNYGMTAQANGAFE